MRRIPADPRHELGRGLLGARIAGLRTERGLTVRGLAQASGVSLGYVSGIESGARLPGLDVLERLAGALGVLVSDLIAGVYPWGSPDEPAEDAPPRRRAGL